MLIHKCKLAVISNVLFEKSKVTLELNSDTKFIISNYVGPQFKCGRFCIYNTNSRNEILNFYLLDEMGCPFQVFGNLDLLQEGAVIYDSTKEITKEIAYATQISIHAFKILFKQEVEDNKEKLLEVENFIFNYVLNNKSGWKTSKKQVCELIAKFDLPIELTKRIRESIKVAPMPKIALNKKPSINLEEYSDSAFVRI